MHTVAYNFPASGYMGVLTMLPYMSHVMRKPVYAICEQHKKKGADQPAHLQSLISTFVVRCLDNRLPARWSYPPPPLGNFADMPYLKEQ